MEIFERQLGECGIRRNGSRVTMDPLAPGHVRGIAGSLLAEALSSGSTAAAASGVPLHDMRRSAALSGAMNLQAVTATTKAQADQAVHATVQVR